MSLSQLIEINSGRTRSINLQRDSKNTQLIDAYLPTTKSLQALTQFAKGFELDNLERSIALIGPYGSGKSAFALFLSALLSRSDSPEHQAAIEVLRRHKASEEIVSPFQKIAKGSAYLRLMINGVPGSLIQQIIDCMVKAAEENSLPASLLKRLKYVQKNKTDISGVMVLLEQVQDTWSELGGTGVLLEIDELGKFLEFEAQHPQQQEIHLLQLLAEHSQQVQEIPFQLVVMLHQSFEQYAANTEKRLRDEWQKIQGRFNAFAFIESSEQVLRVVETTFLQKVPLTSEIKDDINRWAHSLENIQALPGNLDARHAIHLFESCYPLHPVTLLVLPTLCQKAAQNERTLFTYLGGNESFGFLTQLDELDVGDWIYPFSLFDYFFLNQSHGFSDPLSYKRWLEVVTALSRLEADEFSEEAKLLKTIGLLNLIGSQKGLKASQTILNASSAGNLDTPLECLQKQSLVTYRAFNQEFRVWQGSDFDINSAMQSMQLEFDNLPLAETINKISPLNALFVRGVSIETGVTRSFSPLFIDEFTDKKQLASDDFPQSILFYLASDESNGPSSDQVREMGCFNVVAVCPPSFTNRIREVVLEHLALQELPNRHTEIHSDSVIEYEYQEWLAAAELRSYTTFRSLVESPELLTWYFEDQQKINSRHELQRLLSWWVKHECYPESPTLHNELINCEKPSSSAVTGRKRLIEAMLHSPTKKKLGIEKTPAELCIYLSVLARSGLHRKEGNHWGFFPPSKVDISNLRPLWDKIDELLGNEGEVKIPVEEIYNVLQRRPYGVPAGVLPLLLMAYLLANKRSVALYQDGIFCDELTADLVAMLVRRPVYFSIERFDLSGLRGELFDQYFRQIIGKEISEDASLLEIVKPLIRFINQLPPYSKQCKDVSPVAQKVRAAFMQAHSPGVLLFRSLPEACGLDPAIFEVGEQESVEAFIKQLMQVLRELNQAYPNLVHHWQLLVTSNLLDEPVSDLPALRSALNKRYMGLDSLTPDQKVLGAYVRRITEPSDKTDEAWLMSIGTLLSGVPAEKWGDKNRVQAELILKERSQQVRDLERLRLAESNEDESGDSMLIRWMGQQGEQSRVIQLSASQRKRVKVEVEKIDHDLSKLDDTQRLVVLGMLLEKLPK